MSDETLSDAPDPPAADQPAPEPPAPEPPAPVPVVTAAYNPAGARPGMNPAEETERLGHTVRSYRIAVAVGALALAWTRQEQAPSGAVVIADREVSPLGRLAKMWPVPAERTLALAVILRPPLGVDDADMVWILGALAATEAAEVVSGRPISSWWPDTIVDESGRLVGAIKAEIQLGPGKVRSAVVSMRLDLASLGLEVAQREELLDAVLTSLDSHLATLGEGPSGVAAAYQARCSLLGKRVKIRLLPKGEARGVPRGIDRQGRLEIESSSGMVQRLSIDVLRDYEIV
ncbi:MAG: hypothetical protein ABIW46_09600 [Acidimicrobiales bacterium]